MFAQHPAAAALKKLGAFKPAPKPAGILDSAKPAEKILDDTSDVLAADFAIQDLSMSAVATIQQWVETAPEDLEEGETLADRLLAMFCGIADSNMDGDISEDEAAVVDLALNVGFDYLTAKGVSEEDAVALLNDGDEAAAQRVAELLKSALPDGEDASLADIDAFVFDPEAQESVFDSVDTILDAVYKKRVAVRGGKKVRINKRVSGTVRLSAAQKVAIRKAQRKSSSAAAKISRMKSLRVRARAGLDKK